MPQLMAQEFADGAFLKGAGLAGRLESLSAGKTFFSQGDAADCVFFLQQGSAKVTITSSGGRRAILALLAAGDFLGEESLVDGGAERSSTARAVTPCSVVKIERREMIRMLRTDTRFSEAFLKFLLLRKILSQASLVDHMFNCSEKRLARILQSMAEAERPGNPPVMIPKVTHEQLAEMVGTTRSRISYFMNRFRKVGFIEYKDRIQVNSSLIDFASSV